MKNGCFVKAFASIILVVVVCLSSIIPVYAAGAAAGALMESILGKLIDQCLTPDGGSSELSGEQKLAYLNSVWIRSCDNLKEVDYDVLSYVYAQLLMEGVPCEIRISRGSNQGYYIRGTGDMAYDNGRSVFPIKDRYFSDTRGNVFYAQLPDNGKSPGSTTVPSTTPPSASKDEGTERDSTYISNPTSPTDATSELSALNKLVGMVYTEIKSIHGLWRVNINMYNIQVKLRRLLWDVIDGINNVTDGVYEQVDLLTGYLPRLDDIYNRLFNIQSASWASVDVENRIYSGVAGLGSRLDKLITNGTGLATRLDTLITNSAGIDSRLDSIINNGAVQVNTSSIDARLDKLISMYSKVNSVVLDTAAINGGQIKAAVGGELEDVMFWGQSNYASDISFGFADPLTYTLNDVQEPVIDRPLRGMVLGTAIPSCISGMDDVLQAGIWRRPDGKYVISDTYNASTGEYVQRVRSTAYDGTEKWKMVAKTDGVNMFYLTDKAFKSVNANHFCQSSLKKFSHADYVSNFNTSANAAAKYKNKFTVRYATIGFIVDATEYPDLDAWKTYLSDMTSRGYPLTIWFIPSIDPELGLDYSDGPTVSMLNRTSITVPEGNSTISSARVRITGKYETYDSYTQTADIIAAINNIPPYDDSGLIAAITGMTTPTVTTDLTEVTSRLDLILGELQSSSGSATCEHTYAQHMEQEADCTLPGLMISTCSKCGDSYSEIVDPLGHDWVVSSHVDAVIDPDTGEETASAYDVYTCSRCERTYEDHTGDGAPDEDYSNTSISKLIVQVFSKLGTFAGKLIGFFVHLLDKALTSVDNVISKFNDYTTQISGFGGSYTTWLTGFWGIIPAELQIALTFSVICMALGAVGKKLLFS